MKRWSHRHQLRLINEISVTPLLDVVLVLMLVFMLTAPLLNDGTKGALVLPLASSPTKPPAPKSVATLSMDKDQTVRLEGKPLAVADLGAELINLARARPETGVLVQMHRDLPVQALVELMDKLRAAGISRTAVATSAKTE
ncbi:MAG: ExbD/TolR family protein [Verrucomicrobiaceae bacterium]|jgi:biopolymer transport protein ExbD